MIKRFLIFYVKSKIDALFSSENSFIEVILFSIMSLLIALYGFGLAYFFDLSYSNKILITPISILKTLNYVIIFLVIFRNIFPVYNKRVFLFPRFLPISAFQRFTCEFLSVLSSPFFLLSIFFITPLLISDYINILLYFNLLLLLLNSILLEVILKKNIEEDILFKNTIAFISSLLSIVFILYNYFYDYFTAYNTLLFYSISFITFFTINIVIENSIYNKIGKTTNISEEKLNRISSTKTVLNLLFIKKGARLSILVGFAFKTLYTIACVYTLLSKNKFAGHSEVLFLLFMSPAIYFTYVLNNLFGFIKELWINIHLNNGSSTLGLLYLQSSIIFVVVDFSIFITFLIIVGKFNFNFILMYIVSSLLLLLNGFFSSFYLPKYIPDKFSINSIQTSSSIIALVTSLIIVFTVYYFVIDYYLLFTLLIIFLTTLTFYVIRTKSFISANYKIYNNIFK